MGILSGLVRDTGSVHLIKRPLPFLADCIISYRPNYLLEIVYKPSDSHQYHRMRHGIVGKTESLRI